MKVYVDELPKSCSECPCMNEDYERGCWCNIKTSLDIQTDYDKETFTSKCHRQRHEECPLQPLSDYTKQVRKEVIRDLKEEFKKNGKCSIRVNGTMDFFIELDKLNEILDQIATTE